MNWKEIGIGVATVVVGTLIAIVAYDYYKESSDKATAEVAAK